MNDEEKRCRCWSWFCHDCNSVNNLFFGRVFNIEVVSIIISHHDVKKCIFEKKHDNEFIRRTPHLWPLYKVEWFLAVLPLRDSFWKAQEKEL